MTDYYIITKTELNLDGFLTETDQGYTQDIELVNDMNEEYDATYGKFYFENKTKIELGKVTIKEFFDETPFVLNAGKIVNDFEMVKELPLINNENKNTI